MDRYDPSQPPEPGKWLELDEQERIMLVEDHHRRARTELPNARLHAALHVVVENQLAANDEPVVRAQARLMEDGLTRHDAVHAIGSVVARHIYAVLKPQGGAEFSQARYYADVERLTRAKWHEDNDG